MPVPVSVIIIFGTVIALNVKLQYRCNFLLLRNGAGKGTVACVGAVNRHLLKSPGAGACAR